MRKSFFLQGVGLVAAMSLIPAISAGFAASDVDTYKELDQFMSIYERVKADYVDKVDDKTLIRGAIDGMLAALDPHSSYLDARDYVNLKTQTEGNYGGLGLTVQAEDGVIKVVTASEDTPAYRAGIKSGDYITNIDGKLIYGSSLDEAVDKMRGAPGTQVRITIVRPGRDKPFDVTLTREIIELKAVKWQVKGRVGVIDINSFSKATGPGVHAAIAGIEKTLGGRPLGYVIDLRSNPGGLLDQAVEVSDTFLDHGEIVSQRGREKNDIERFFAHPGDEAHGLPVIVLVDAGTASAAEIVAGALQDQHRALIMGERSFGKGSVQTVMPLTDETALRLTIARYYTPSGRSVQENGIAPDVIVPQLNDPDYKARPRLREADLRHHLLNSVKGDDKILEDDTNPDPRFAATPDSLKKVGVTDFQLDYAVKTIARLGPAAPVKVAAK
ncbi:carboxyl-terminal processing protease [Sphingomonas vulcanisoli]|uniref:Carboxyl-terminal processing protease n=1 Tax=Sphingomonas vulcanisoli TaxID=1658060 RepID=A0ABX0TPP4_9SPHN|nr:S41 family peptidase [Sphingomonas vulcanisoli]NIJ07494.1 carboxyl-terminal processing protease [Sphingomonas vulcanisoli]